MLAAACVILLVDLFLSDDQRWITATLTLATLAGAAVITAYVSGVSERVTAFDGMYVADPMGDVLKLFLYLVVGVALLYSREYLAERELFRGEYYVLSLLAMLGIMVIISAQQPADDLSRRRAAGAGASTRWSPSTASRAWRQKPR